VAVLIVVGTTARGTLKELRKPAQVTPTARIERGDVALNVYTTGALEAGHTAMLIAPPVSGGTLKIIHLLKTGTPVKKGDLVMEFDPSEQEYNLEQAKTDLAEAEQEITKAKADAAVQAAQDQVTLLKDQFDVKRAEFEVDKNELVSAIDAKKNTLALAEAKRVLAQLESDIQSHQASSRANLAVNQEKRQKAILAMQEAERNIDSLRVHSPMDGLVEVKLNRQAGGGFYFTGMVLPDFQEGDQAYPGEMVAQVVDPSNMEIQAKVDEGDRGNISQGQPVEVRIDALPGRTFRGKVTTIAGLASRGSIWESSGAMSKFGITIQMEEVDPQLRPGYTAQVTIAANPLRNVLYLPTQAVFEKNGKPVVYVKSGSGFRTQDVKIKSRTETRTVVEGVPKGTEVALLNPESRNKEAVTAAGPLGPAPSGGGR
jgi:HlyD family secretion protein